MHSFFPLFSFPYYTFIQSLTQKEEEAREFSEERDLLYRSKARSHDSRFSVVGERESGIVSSVLEEDNLLDISSTLRSKKLVGSSYLPYFHCSSVSFGNALPSREGLRGSSLASKARDSAESARMLFLGSSSASYSIEK